VVQTDMAYVYADHLDTARVIVRNSDHAIVWRWDGAEPFGATPPGDNPSALGSYGYNPRMPGQVFDAESGNFYNWHRDYGPSIGRFVQSDPIGLKGGVNTYVYVGASPIGAVDLLGLLVEGGGGGGGGGKEECFLFLEIPLGIIGPTLPRPKDTDLVYFWYCIWRCESPSCPPKVRYPQRLVISTIMGCQLFSPPKN
jgi:RHS repeat-associated protein